MADDKKLPEKIEAGYNGAPDAKAVLKAGSNSEPAASPPPPPKK